jgi:hypothetical protein
MYNGWVQISFTPMVTMVCVPETLSLPRFVRHIQCRLSQSITFDAKRRRAPLGCIREKQRTLFTFDEMPAKAGGIKVN